MNTRQTTHWRCKAAPCILSHPPASLHTFPLLPTAYVSVRPRQPVCPCAAVSLYCITISCTAIDDIMSPNGKLLLVLFAKEYTNSSTHSLFPTTKIQFEGGHLLSWCARDFLISYEVSFTKNDCRSFRTVYYSLLLTKDINLFVFLSLSTQKNVLNGTNV